MKLIQITQENVKELAKEIEQSEKEISIRFDSITLGRDEYNLYDGNPNMKISLLAIIYDKDRVSVGFLIQYSNNAQEWIYYRPYDNEAIGLYNEMVSQLSPKTKTYYQNSVDGGLTSFTITELQ